MRYTSNALRRANPEHIRVQVQRRRKFAFRWAQLVVGLGIAAVPLLAPAGNQSGFDTRCYLVPQYAYAWPDGKEDTHNGSAGQFEFGKALVPEWNLEFGVIDYDQAFDNGSAGSYHQITYGLNALWFFNRRTKPFAPMLLFGIGANHQMLNDVGRRCYLDSSGSGSNPMPNTGLKLYGRFGLGVLFAPRDWSGAPRHMEWYGAFALMVTLIWLYLEILRLLSNTRR